MGKKIARKPVKSMSGNVRRPKPLARKAGISKNGKELI
jgi:hypothetical protein